MKNDSKINDKCIFGDLLPKYMEMRTKIRFLEELEHGLARFANTIETQLAEAEEQGRLQSDQTTLENILKTLGDV